MARSISLPSAGTPYSFALSFYTDVFCAAGLLFVLWRIPRAGEKSAASVFLIVAVVAARCRTCSCSPPTATELRRPISADQHLCCRGCTT